MFIKELRNPFQFSISSTSDVAHAGKYIGRKNNMLDDQELTKFMTASCHLS